MKRPAETVTGLTALASAITAAYTGAWEVFTTAIVIGVLPTLVTGWLNNGGCEGIYQRARYGRRRRS